MPRVRTTNEMTHTHIHTCV